jgi:hypothetical protein
MPPVTAAGFFASVAIMFDACPYPIEPNACARRDYESLIRKSIFGCDLVEEGTSHVSMRQGMAIAPDSSPGPRLRALKRLIEYAFVESEDLGEPLLGRLLGAAALVVDEELERLKQDAGTRPVERKLDDGPEQIRRWRMKAEEIRTGAEGFGDGSARRHLLSSAETYDALANNAEARLQRRKDRKPGAG